jgi:hypothetical protein
MNLIVTQPDDLRILIREEIQAALDSTQKPEPVNFLTRREAAQKLRISLPSLHKYTKCGLVKCRRVGGRVLYEAGELDKANI